MSDIIGKRVRITDGQNVIVGDVIEYSDSMQEYPPVFLIQTSIGDITIEWNDETMTFEIVTPPLYTRLDKCPDGTVVSYHDGTQYIKHEEYWYVLGHGRTSADIIPEMLSKDSLASLPQ